MSRTSIEYPIRVDFIDSAEYPILNGLGMTFAPGKKQANPVSGPAWERDLAADLERLATEYCAGTLVSVMEPHEFESLQIADMEDSCGRSGIKWLTFSVVDGSVPESAEEFTAFVLEIVERLERGGRVVVHCKGGLGRTGLTAACVIIAASGGRIGPEEAMRMVRRARPGTVENPQQERFVVEFAGGWMGQLG